jgi:L-ascorbate metabolism protein UlaG (beta-lactamase superfamily)
MIITWYGHSCFKIQSADLVLVTDPFAKEIGLTPPRVRADMVIVSHGHFDHANAESLTGNPFVITGPGEYEVKGTYIHGIETFHDAEKGAKRGMNTIYAIRMEDLTIVHLGDFGEDELRPETADELGSASGGVDILMIPVGGTYTIDAKAAAKIVKRFEPRFVIPMHYSIKGLSQELLSQLDGVEAFLKEMGAGTVEPVEKFTIKKKDIGIQEKTDVIVLSIV